MNRSLRLSYQCTPSLLSLDRRLPMYKRDKTTPPCMITVSSTNCTSTFHDLLLPRVLCLKPFRNASHHNNSYLVRVGSPVFFRSGSLRSPIIEINYNSILCPTKERIALSGVTIALLLRISCKRNKPQERQKEREREREREREEDDGTSLDHFIISLSCRYYLAIYMLCNNNQNRTYIQNHNLERNKIMSPLSPTERAISSSAGVDDDDDDDTFHNRHRRRPPMIDILDSSDDNASIWTSASSITCSVLSNDDSTITSFSTLSRRGSSFWNNTRSGSLLSTTSSRLLPEGESEDDADDEEGDRTLTTTRLNSQRWGSGSRSRSGESKKNEDSAVTSKKNHKWSCCEIPTRRLSSDYYNKNLTKLPYQASSTTEQSSIPEPLLPSQSSNAQQQSQNGSSGKKKKLAAWQLREQWKQTGGDSIPKLPKRRSFCSEDGDGDDTTMTKSTLRSSCDTYSAAKSSSVDDTDTGPSASSSNPATTTTTTKERTMAIQKELESKSSHSVTSAFQYTTTRRSIGSSNSNTSNSGKHRQTATTTTTLAKKVPSRWDPTTSCSPSIATAASRKTINSSKTKHGDVESSSNNTSKSTSTLRNNLRKSSFSSKDRKERLLSSAAATAAAAASKASSTTNATTTSSSKTSNNDNDIGGGRYLPKRYVPKKLLRKRSSDCRRRRTFVDDALASILEDPEKEGSSLSPVTEEKGSVLQAPNSCPTIIMFGKKKVNRGNNSTKSSSTSTSSTSTATTTSTTTTDSISNRSLLSIEGDERKRPMSCEDASQWVSVEKKLGQQSNGNNNNNNDDAEADESFNDSISGADWSGVGSRNLLLDMD